MGKQAESLKSLNGLTLTAALKAGNLEAFIAQAEAEGVAPAEAAKVFATMAQAIKPPPEEDQTSPDPSRDGSA